MTELSIDIETFSTVDIKSGGSFKYSEDAEIILFGYSVDKAPARCIDLLSGEIIPPEIIKAIVDENVVKKAHNAAFERAVISNALNIELPPEQWRCSAVLSAVAGYPLSLDESSKALGTSEKKDSEGKALIRYFCIPCKPTKANGGRTRNLPEHAPEKWAKFIEYCKQDVVTEQAISDALSWVEISEQEQKLWCLDQKINARGWKVDTDLANCAIELDAIFRDRLTAEAKRITGLSNPNSVAQLKTWIEEQEGIKISGLAVESVNNLLSSVKGIKTKRVLEIRQEMSKTSIKKYVAMLNAVSSSQRVRGLFQFYGAGRTGRWAGRLVQVQNLPRISDDIAPVLMLARELVKNKDSDMLDLCFGSLSTVLSQLIRTAFIAEDGHRLIISDFSAIEARVIAWLAGEQWRLDIFSGSGKIYEASASQMFKVPLESIKKGMPNYVLRAKGKVAELACGYQGGKNALIRMGALNMGLTEKELPGIIKAWREASPNIVRLWYDLQRAAMECIETRGKVKVGDKGIYFIMQRDTLLLYLPSGRALYYPKASIEHFIERIYLVRNSEGELLKVPLRGIEKDHVKLSFEDVERSKIVFWAVDQFTRKWGKTDTYGGKLAENVTQAIARDCLANAMLNLDSIGVKIVSHVHDEIIAEMLLRVSSLEEINRMMIRPAPWMEGLPLGAEGDESLYYNK